MAAPVFQGVGLPQGGTGALSVPWPSHVAGDLGFLVVQTACEAVTTPSGWTFFAECDNGEAAASTTANRFTVYWRWAASGAEANAAVNDPGNHAYAVIFTVRGANPVGNGVDSTANSRTIALPADPSVFMQSLTTNSPECLVIGIVSDEIDGTSTTRYSNWANGSLTGVTERFDNGTNAGVGGGLGIVSGVKTTAGLTDGFTATVTSAAWVAWMFAIKPPPGPQTITGIGLASGEVWGSPVLTAGGGEVLSAQGIASAEAFGSASIRRMELVATGIPSAEAWGAPGVVSAQSMSATGIASAGAFGTAAIGHGQLVIGFDPPDYSNYVPYSYAIPLLGDGGTAPLTWAVTGLRPGLTCDPATGVVYGRPRPVAAPPEIVITVTDALGRTGTQTVEQITFGRNNGALSGRLGEPLRAQTYTGNGASSRVLTLGTPDARQVYIKRRDAVGPWVAYTRDAGTGQTLRQKAGSDIAAFSDSFNTSTGAFTLPEVADVNVSGAEYLLLDMPSILDASHDYGSGYETSTALAALLHEGDGTSPRAFMPSSVKGAKLLVLGSSAGALSTWYVGSAGATKYTDGAGTQVTDSTVWANTAPAGYEYTVGSSARVNKNGVKHTGTIFGNAVYTNPSQPLLPSPLFITRQGTYTGNGSATGPVIDVDMPIRLLLVFGPNGQKPVLVDTARSPTWSSAAAQQVLSFDDSAEETLTLFQRSNQGVQVVSTDARVNTNGATYTYYAVIDDQPWHEYLIASGIPSAEAWGTPSIAVEGETLFATGIQSAQAFGTPTLQPGNATLAATGLASAEAWGMAEATLALGQTITAVALASSEAWGTPAITSAVTLLASAIASGEAWGVPSLQSATTLQAAGIGSALVFGDASLSVGPVTLQAAGIASGEAFGTVTITGSGVQLAPAGLPSAESWGTAAVTSSTTLVAGFIATAEAWGTPGISSGNLLAATSIVSGEAWGSPTATPGVVTLQASGLPSAEGWGTAALQPGAVTLLASGIGSATAFGAARIGADGNTLFGFSVDSAEAFGLAAIEPGVATLHAQGIPSLESFGLAYAGGGARDVPFQSVARPRDGEHDATRTTPSQIAAQRGDSWTDDTPALRPHETTHVARRP